MVTKEELADIRKGAEFDRDHVGAPGCKVRQRAEKVLELVEAYEKALIRAEADEVAKLPLVVDGSPKTVPLFLQMDGKDVIGTYSRDVPALELVRVEVENGVLTDAIMQDKARSEKPGTMEVRVRYFKQGSGKWVHEGEYISEVPSRENAYYWDVIEEFRAKQFQGPAPGISTNGADYFVLLEGEHDLLNPPVLLMPLEPRQ